MPENSSEMLGKNSTLFPQNLKDVSDREIPGLLSEETRDAIFAVYTWLMPTNSLLTVIFCVINAAVYWQQRAATFALYLIGVDIGDGLCAVVKLCSNVAYFTLPSTAYDRLLIDWYLAKYVALSFRRAATCLNMLASMERFLAIAFPLKNISRSVFGKPFLTITSVFLACFVAHSYMVFEYHVVSDEDGDWWLTGTEWKKVYPGVFVILGNLVSIVFAYAPLIVILVLNFLLLLKLRAHSSSLKHMRRSHGSNSDDIACKTSVQTDPHPENTTTTNSQTSKARAKSNTQEDILHKNDDKAPTRQSSFQNNGNHSNHQTPTITSKQQQQHGKTVPDYPKTTQNGKKTADPEKVRSETSVTKMVMVFTTAFFLLALPSMLSFTARHLFPEYGPEGREANLYRSMSTLSMLISHLTEPTLFWVSFAYSRHFRRAVFRLPGARWCCGRCLAVTSFLSTSSSDVSGRVSGSSSSSRGMLSESDGY